MRETKNDWRETIRRLCLFDDVMMTKCLDDIAVAQHVLRVILRRPLVVKRVKAQATDESAAWRGVRFDILAVDEGGRRCDIEVQRRDTGDLAKRAAFYSAALVKEALEKGECFDSLRETFVIFITETDVFKKGKAEYNFIRRCEETGETLDDGARIVFVNGGKTCASYYSAFAHTLLGPWGQCPQVGRGKEEGFGRERNYRSKRGFLSLPMRRKTR